MNSLDRIRQLTGLGIDVRVGNDCYQNINFDGPKKTWGLRIISIYPDGSREYASPALISRGTKESTAEYKGKLLDILKNEGVDIDSTRGLKTARNMKIDLHTLVLPNDEMFQFLLPATDYLAKRK